MLAREKSLIWEYNWKKRYLLKLVFSSFFRWICILLQQRIFISQPQDSLFWLQSRKRRSISARWYRVSSHSPHANRNIVRAITRIVKRNYRLPDTSSIKRGNIQGQCWISEWASSILVNRTNCDYCYCLACSGFSAEKFLCWETRPYLKKIQREIL